VRVVDNVGEERSLLVRFFKAPIMVNRSLHSKAYARNFILTMDTHYCNSFTCALRRRRAALDDSRGPDSFISWKEAENNWDKITIINAAKATCAFSKASAVTIKDKGNAKRTYNGDPPSEPPHDVVMDVANSKSNFSGESTVLIAIGSGGFEATWDAEKSRFDFKCDVEDGWKHDDGAGETRNTIGEYHLPDQTTDLIKEFAEMYLRSKTPSRT